VQIAVNVQTPIACGGLGGQTVYIDTEGSFSTERVADMCGCVSH
jgi:RAD51-like protein 2